MWTRFRIALAVVLAFVLVASGAVVVVLAHHCFSDCPLSASALHAAEKATVKLVMGPENSPGSGSGTLISADGLILTNGHVAEPRAAGEAVSLGVPGSLLEANPPYLTVEMTTSGGIGPVVAFYRAKPVAVDGYLDMAVVQIYATNTGQLVDASSLHLPYLKVGDPSTLQLNSQVTVLGFPGVSESESLTVTTGGISAFVPDPDHHVSDPRFELETTARIAHGNSGGAAIDNTGKLIGVPSQGVPGQGNDVSFRLRSVSEARPLIDAARNHAVYPGTELVPLGLFNAVTGVGVGGGNLFASINACRGAGSTAATDAVTFGINYVGLGAGVDVAVVIRLPDGTLLQNSRVGDNTLAHFTVPTSSGCFTYQLSASDWGAAALPTGNYGIQLLAGPNLEPIGRLYTVDVGD
jgi:Trypsin-like peptidase domain